MVTITILGITHIDIASQEKVQTKLREIHPEAVCLEIDKQRLEVLLEQEKISSTDISKIKNEIDSVDFTEQGEAAAAAAKTMEDYADLLAEKSSNAEEYSRAFTSILDDIGFFENHLAKLTETDLPGKEMVVAYRTANELGCKVFLIDRDIREINDLMSKDISQQEAEAFQDMIDELLFDNTLIAKPIENTAATEQPTIETSEDEESDVINLFEILAMLKNPNVLTQILEQFQQTFPELYSVLLKDRDSYMADKILEIVNDYDSIVVILGYGHVQSVAKILEEKEPDCVIKII